MLTFLLLAALVASAVGMDLTSVSIRSMGNNTLFTRWRPISHLMPPAGKVGDPSGFMHDPVRDEYHMFYQWHPHHINWGNISWGHAVSKDFVSWTDVNGWQGDRAVALAPEGNNGTYDGLGVFSGSALPINLEGKQDGTHTMFYTGARFLPTFFYKDYVTGTESQAMATSKDGGRTWQRLKKNPVIPSPPKGWSVTAWRDFVVEPAPYLDKIIGQSEPHYYAVFGSGIHRQGPRVPLYAAPASDLTHWTFLGPLWEPRIKSSLGSVFETKHNGASFELSSLFDLVDDKGKEHYYVSIGTEFMDKGVHKQWPIYYEGTLTRRKNGSPEFHPISGGAADNGNLYALTTFRDTKKKRRIMIGWTDDDIIGDDKEFSSLQQGHRGALSFPRELFVHTVRGVVDKDLNLRKPGISVFTPGSDSSFTARTLGIKVASDVAAGIRKGAVKTTHPGGTYRTTGLLIPKGGSHYELSVTMTGMTGKCGIRIGSSPDKKEFTDIYYDPVKNAIVVDRRSSSLLKEFNAATVQGFFKPYWLGKRACPTCVKKVSMEDINWKIYLDGSLLEVYVNDRFALTTRIYPSLERSTGIGVFLAPGAMGTFKNIVHYGDLKNIWPERPRDSSAPLVYDTPEQTGDYTWWRGN